MKTKTNGQIDIELYQFSLMKKIADKILIKLITSLR
jgi:hypothetical protein